jgi:hypothetical protein
MTRDLEQWPTQVTEPTVPEKGEDFGAFLDPGAIDLVPKRKLPRATQAKYGKPPVYSGVLAMFPRAILELARVSEFGAKKHEVSLPQQEFLDVPDAETVYKNAEARHLIGEALYGPINATDGGVYIAAQRAWNALADLEVLLRRVETDMDAPMPLPPRDLTQSA